MSDIKTLSYFFTKYISTYSPIISSALAAVLGKWDLPVFTLPFNLSVGLFMAATGHYNHHFPQIRIEPVTTSYNITWPDLSIPMVSNTMLPFKSLNVVRWQLH